MVYYEIVIKTELFSDTKSITEIQSTSDTYDFTGNSIADLRRKIDRVFGSDHSWLDDAGIDLYYTAISDEKVIYLNHWSNLNSQVNFNSLIYGEA